MGETYTGTVVELGGAELGQSGNEKPRKVVLKDNPESQYGKTFRIWSSDGDFPKLVLGKVVTVEYEVNPIPNTTYTQNMIEAVQDVGGAGNGAREAVNGSSDDWTAPPPEVGSPSAQSSPRSAAPPPASRYTDPVTRDIVASWAITNAIRLGHTSPDDLHSFSHKLIVLRDQIAAELSE